MRGDDVWLGILAMLGIAVAIAALSVSYLTATWAIEHHVVARSTAIFHKMERWAAKP